MDELAPSFIQSHHHHSFIVMRRRKKKKEADVLQPSLLSSTLFFSPLPSLDALPPPPPIFTSFFSPLSLPPIFTSAVLLNFPRKSVRYFLFVALLAMSTIAKRIGLKAFSIAPPPKLGFLSVPSFPRCPSCHFLSWTGNIREKCKSNFRTLKNSM